MYTQENLIRAMASLFVDSAFNNLYLVYSKTGKNKCSSVNNFDFNNDVNNIARIIYFSMYGKNSVAPQRILFP